MTIDKPQQSTESAFSLLSKFVRLRQNGLNRDDAWYQVIDSSVNLNEVTVKAFLTLAKNWERQEGHKYRYYDAKNESTQPRSEVPVVKREDVPPQAQPPRRSASLTGTLDPGRLREYEQNRLEQVLDQLDDLPDDEEEAVSPQAGVSHLAPVGYRRDFFGPRTVLLMHFQTRAEPLRVVIDGEAELYIGRSTSNAAMSPDVDLNVVGAANFGVSRFHSAITRRQNQLLITDTESMNHTFVNGVRLLPKEVRVVCDGDDVWFGHLGCKIRFQHT